MFWGMLNGVLIGILVYFSDRIDTTCWNHMLFYFGVKYSMDYVTHIFQKKKYTPLPPPPPLLRIELLECIMSKILHTNLFTGPVYTNTHFFFWNFTSSGLQNQHAYYACWNTLSSYEVICITRQKYKVEQLPILRNMENKSRQNVCLASCITSEFSRCISHSNWNRKSVAFFRVFL